MRIYCDPCYATGARMSDDFTKRKLDWLDQVADDLELSAAKFRLAYVIARFVNRASGEAWPTQQTLATTTGMTISGVQKASDALEERGHLTVVSQPGRNKSNHYQLVYKNPDSRLPFIEEKPRRPSAISVEKTQTAVREKADGCPRKDRPTSVQNTLIEHTEEHTESISVKTPPIDKSKRTRQKKSTEAEGFEEFWHQYPRRVAKDAARKAYAAALKRATPAELLAGAMRYSEQRDGQDEKYTKHPATWLNGGCWADEPAQTRPNGASAPQRPHYRLSPGTRTWPALSRGANERVRHYQGCKRSADRQP
jgi:hypothetical protein